ncbi:MAG: hypothetical protein HYY40_09905 [Bacteroidetes bacterium]|nr:hypothetical protein [Bacteroidota bacterium]
MKSHTLFTISALIIIFCSQSFPIMAQNNHILVVLDIPTKGILYDDYQMGNLIRTELGKTGAYQVLSIAEAEQTLKKSGKDFKECYHKSCLFEAAKVLNAAKVLSGNIERFGEKIVFVLQIIDVASGNPEKSTVAEFYNVQQYVEQMAEISVKKLMGMPVDKYMESTLVIPQYLVLHTYNKVLARGPRMGLTYLTGNYGKRMSDSYRTGGYNMIPLMSVFGYQYEEQYMSSGDVQGLVNFFGFAGGIESGLFIPGVAVITGLRLHRSGLEIGIGPAAWVYKGTRGFFDVDGKVDTTATGKGRWYSIIDDPAGSDYYYQNPDVYPLKTLPDRRGEVRMDFSLLYSIGKTFHFGSIDIPLNIIIITTRKDYIISAVTGFNVKRKSRKSED